jgi:hypothetical protein
MKFSGWRRAWILTSVIMLFFPFFFLLIEMPTEDKVLRAWSIRMLWKTQAAIPEYQETGMWPLEHELKKLPVKDIITSLENRFGQVDYSSIRQEYQARLQNIRTGQMLVAAEATLIYLFVIAAMYGVGRCLEPLLHKLGNTLRRKKGLAKCG